MRKWIRKHGAKVGYFGEGEYAEEMQVNFEGEIISDTASMRSTPCSLECDEADTEVAGILKFHPVGQQASILIVQVAPPHVVPASPAFTPARPAAPNLFDAREAANELLALSGL